MKSFKYIFLILSLVVLTTGFVFSQDFDINEIEFDDSVQDIDVNLNELDLNITAPIGTDTPEETSSPAASATSTETSTPSTPTPSATSTETSTPSTPTPSATSTETSTPSTPTPTATETETSTPSTPTPTATETDTATPEETSSPSATPTSTGDCDSCEDSCTIFPENTPSNLTLPFDLSAVGRKTYNYLKENKNIKIKKKYKKEVRNSKNDFLTLDNAHKIKYSLSEDRNSIDVTVVNSFDSRLVTNFKFKCAKKCPNGDADCGACEKCSPTRGVCYAKGGKGSCTPEGGVDQGNDYSCKGGQTCDPVECVCKCGGSTCHKCEECKDGSCALKAGACKEDSDCPANKPNCKDCKCVACETGSGAAACVFGMIKKNTNTEPCTAAGSGCGPGKECYDKLVVVKCGNPVGMSVTVAGVMIWSVTGGSYGYSTDCTCGTKPAVAPTNPCTGMPFTGGAGGCGGS